MTLQEDGTILLFQDGRISVLEPDGAQREVANGLCPGNTRFNDVIADPEGRVFAGAMGGNGRLMRFDPDGSSQELFDGVGIPNGMGLIPELRHLYFTDSIARTIYRFEYDRDSGTLSNRQVFVEIPESEGIPDGLTVDANEFVWAAIWFGGRLKRFAPNGTFEREIHFPVAQISSVILGGTDLSEMYITTAASKATDRLKPPEYDPLPEFRGGGLYSCRIAGIRGPAEFGSRLCFQKGS